MNKKFQIFISSTYEDLKEERKKVQDAILKIHHFPIGMEMFSAADEEQWEIIKETIDSSDYYVLIIGYRYGSVIEEGADKGMSYTEKEYHYAVSQGIPILAFLVDEKKVAVTPDKMEQDSNKRKRLEKFKEIFTKRKIKMVDFWENSEDLKSKVVIALTNEFKRGNRVGWVRDDSLNVKSNKIEVVERNINTYKDHYSVSYFKTREEIDEKLNPLKNMFTDVCSLNIVTVSGINLLDVHGKKILNLLEKEVDVKLVVLKVGTNAFEEHFANKLDSLGHLKGGSVTTWESWVELCEKYHKLKLKYTDICLPYNILYVKKKNQNESFIKVDLYAINAEPHDRPCMYIKPEDEMFDYFIKQFNIIWETGHKV